ncbi:hypothetical protein WL80_26900 [Burkholderia ubonensis]|nr:hypothetical protein WL80_26900 [Burkholderia ubonensis]
MGAERERFGNNDVIRSGGPDQKVTPASGYVRRVSKFFQPSGGWPSSCWVTERRVGQSAVAADATEVPHMIATIAISADRVRRGIVII